MPLFSNKKQIFYLIYAVAFLVGAVIYALPKQPARIEYPKNFKVLVFSKTTSYRHESIPAGIEAIRSLGAESGFTVDATEDADVFTAKNLNQYRVIVFLSTSGNDILSREQKAAFARFIKKGGGFVGIHAATTTEYGWRWYGEMIGAHFKNHPPIQKAITRVADPKHISTIMLPSKWVRQDEWYNFYTALNPHVHVLLIVDEATYNGGAMGYHPVSWCQEFDGGRVWYTAMGHASEDYREPLFRQHILGGILWASGRKE